MRSLEKLQKESLATKAIFGFLNLFIENKSDSYLIDSVDTLNIAQALLNRQSRIYSFFREKKIWEIKVVENEDEQGIVAPIKIEYC